ncbi:MAG: hypothetical protein WC752_01010 [Patescibacteria group bacterium]
MSNVSNIAPLGNLNPTGGHIFPTDHIYLYLNKEDDTVTPVTTNVYAPGDIWITNISSIKHLSADPIYTDYNISFSPCTEVDGLFGHVISITEKLKDAYNAGIGECQTDWVGEQKYKFCSKNISVFIPKGTKIGTAGGQIGQNALDFTLSDTQAKALEYINPDHWGDFRLHYVCPLDYFGSTKKAKMQTLLGRINNWREIKPVCGRVEYDVPERAQGAWFEKGTTGQTWDEDNQLALVPDNYYPEQLVFSVGQSLSEVGLEVGAYYFNPQGSGLVNRKFSEVKNNGKIYCYEAGNEVILIKLKNKVTLRIGTTDLPSCGSGPWSFNGNYKDFER